METTQPRLFERLKAGLEEGVEYARGKKSLRTTELALPDPPRAYTQADIKELREKRNWSQSMFAEILCVSPKTVQSWEQGLRTPNQAVARLLQFIEDPRALEIVTGQPVTRAKVRRRSAQSVSARGQRTPEKSSTS